MTVAQSLRRQTRLLAKKGMAALGYELRRKPFNPSESFAWEVMQVVGGHTMLGHAQLLTLVEQVRHCEDSGIPGAFVECGVWKGGACGAMAVASLEFGEGRRELHMFDAFDDICEPDPEMDGDFAVSEVARLANVDSEELQGRLRPVRGVYDSMGGHGTITVVDDLLVKTIGYDPSLLHYHVGWFQETLPLLQRDDLPEIAILRLDADLYASTKVCLEHLYPKVVKGGFVLIDDYGRFEGCRAAVDEYRAEHGVRDFFTHATYGCSYWIKS